MWILYGKREKELWGLESNIGGRKDARVLVESWGQRGMTIKTKLFEILNFTWFEFNRERDRQREFGNIHIFLDLGDICSWNNCSGKGDHGCGKVTAILPLNSVDFPISLVAHHTLFHSFDINILSATMGQPINIIVLVWHATPNQKEHGIETKSVVLKSVKQCWVQFLACHCFSYSLVCNKPPWYTGA